MIWFLKGLAIYTILCLAMIGVLAIVVTLNAMLNRSRHPDEETWQPESDTEPK